MARPKAQPYHHGQLREALAASGRALLEEKGIRGFTLRECARRAGVSHAAPAYHFASIDDLLAELATRGFQELAAAMTAEAERADGEAVEGGSTSRLVAQGVGYMAFAAGNPALFQLMFSREANRLETPALAAAAEAVRNLHAAAVEAVIPHASGEIKQRMADFAGASVHGFISLLLDGQIGGKDSSRALKARGLSLLSAMAETVVRVAR
ncbi:MAG: TetR/AcrR family transcriptional regulator [Reyranella sp.]|uniref:TetR/AcrR family transcriptional regulator n=1 Tax=Reyranella sp. TaxID=1929291 RepID=UPI00121CFB4D|nr:TetR/AcrR family transcriptional regulator [Reyranella sp.]TAJ38019.1 MAG: TetR/AcrR family transcriptional regulator [Reyranella sp.]